MEIKSLPVYFPAPVLNFKGNIEQIFNEANTQNSPVEFLDF